MNVANHGPLFLVGKQSCIYIVFRNKKNGFSYPKNPFFIEDLHPLGRPQTHAHLFKKTKDTPEYGGGVIFTQENFTDHIFVYHRAGPGVRPVDAYCADKKGRN